MIFTANSDTSNLRLPADAMHALFAYSLRRKLRYLYKGNYFKFRNESGEFDYPETPLNGTCYLVKIYDQKLKYGIPVSDAYQDDPSKQPLLVEEQGGVVARFQLGQYLKIDNLAEYITPDFTITAIGDGDVPRPMIGFYDEYETTINRLYAFGNSYTDSGNYPDELWLDREDVWVQYLAQVLSVPFSPSSDGGTNYAFGGARLIENVNHGGGITAPSIQSQINSAPSFTPNDLIAFFGGGNDYLGAGESSTYIFNGIESNLRALIAKGAQNIVVLNMVNLFTLPAVSDASARTVSEDINSSLATLVESLRRDHGIKIRLLDFFTLVDSIATNPASYGITEVFYDSVHLTEEVHRIIANKAYELFSRSDIITVEPGSPTNRFTFNDNFGSIGENTNNRINQLFSGVDSAQNGNRVIKIKSDGGGSGQNLNDNIGTDFTDISIGRAKDRYFAGDFIEATMHLGDLTKLGAEQLWEEAKLVY